MQKILVIGTYFGAWPEWFPAFYLSCVKNEKVDWLLFTDCRIPAEPGQNIKFVLCSIDQLNNLASKKLGFCIQKGRYSQVDLRPAYGVIFEQYLRGYDFWGHCDFDVIWGDLRRFITEAILDKHQIISSRKNRLAGHFTLWKNEPEINTLFKSAPTYRSAFSNKEYVRFDEKAMYLYLNERLTHNKNSKLRVYWPETIVVDWPELEANPKGWHWKNSKLFDRENQERIYMHFMTWKKFMNHIDFKSGEQIAKFSITRRGIWSVQPPVLERFLETTQMGAWYRLQPLRLRKKSKKDSSIVHKFKAMGV